MTSQAAWHAAAAFWPRAETSRFVQVDNIDFHVQVSGAGEDVLLLHGAGASAHSRAFEEQQYTLADAGARGKAGSNLNYLNNTLDHLEELGLRDENLTCLQAAVRSLGNSRTC